MQNNIQEHRLQHFPIPLFAIVMGLCGLAIVYQKAAVYFGYSPIIAQILTLVATLVFVILLGAYGLKMVLFRESVKHEFTHPIRLNFFPAVSICLLLLSILFEHLFANVSCVLWYVGAPLHLFFTLYVIRFWIVNNLEITHSNPAWFIPIVGNVLVPILGVEYGGIEVATFYFAIGMFFWIVLFAIILNRIIFHHQLASKFLPTLFIFIAPAGIGFISYIKINTALGQALDLFGYMIYDIGLFFTLLLFFMIAEFAKVKFAITWWAYTFPMAAITIATILMYSITSSFFMYILSQILIVITSIIVAIVAFATLKAFMKREICIAE